MQNQIARAYHLNGASNYLEKYHFGSWWKMQMLFCLLSLTVYPQSTQETCWPKIKCQLNKKAHRSQVKSDMHIHPNINDSSRAFSHPPPRPPSTQFMTTLLSILFKQKSHFNMPFKQSQRLLLFKPLHFAMNKSNPAVLSGTTDSCFFFF